MPNPTRQDRRIHKAFLLRQKAYESRFIPRIKSVLAIEYRNAAAIYPQPYVVNPNDYRQVIESIYTTCLPNEAKIAWDTYVRPLTGDRKDFFDDLASLLGFNVPEGEFIRIWREISKEWLNVNILTKIQGIAATTQRAIAKVIERGISEGLSERDIAKAIREQAQGRINEERSKLIARTETISAMNKGRRIAMYTSNLAWLKRWIDTPDERTRTSHRIVANEEGRALDEPYTLIRPTGGTEECQCPGDPVLSAANICNCRCCETYEVQRDASGKPIRRGLSPIKVSEAVEFIG